MRWRGRARGHGGLALLFALSSCGKGAGASCPTGEGQADAGAIAAGPSCSGSAAGCGPAHDEDCCASRFVPGNAPGATLACEGPSWRSCDASSTDPNDGDAPCSLGSPAEVSDFHLDRFEVTVGRFRSFAGAYDAWRAAGHPAAGEGGDPHVADGDTRWSASDGLAIAESAAALVGAIDACGGSWVDTPGVDTETKAMGCVDWYEAAAFCLWDGGWLVTEAESSYAAAGGSQARVYPWSSPPASAVIDPSYADYDDGIHVPQLTDVGAFSPKGDGRWGHADLGGNVFEWTWDLFGTTFPSPCTDCVQGIADAAGDRARRGGGYLLGPAYVRSAAHGGHIPTFRNPNLGFRCAR